MNKYNQEQELSCLCLRLIGANYLGICLQYIPDEDYHIVHLDVNKGGFLTTINGSNTIKVNGSLTHCLDVVDEWLAKANEDRLLQVGNYYATHHLDTLIGNAY